MNILYVNWGEETPEQTYLFKAHFKQTFNGSSDGQESSRKCCVSNPDRSVFFIIRVSDLKKKFDCMLYVTANIFHIFLHSFSYFILAILLHGRVNPNLKEKGNTVWKSP